MMDYDEQVEALAALQAAVKYIKQAHDEAEAKHDSYGEYYMDGGQYEIMEDTDQLLAKIEAILEKAK